VSEADRVGLAVAQHLQQQPDLAFAGASAAVGGVGQPDGHALAEPGDLPVADGGVELGAAGGAGPVGLADQLAQPVGDLGRPDRVAGTGRGQPEINRRLTPRLSVYRPTSKAQWQSSAARSCGQLLRLRACCRLEELLRPRLAEDTPKCEFNLQQAVAHTSGLEHAPTPTPT
jgi:hypothetical protein